VVNKTKIEWCDFTVNPIIGQCPHKCWYCYAEPIRKRFYGTEIQFLPDRLNFTRKPATIFVGSMFDIFAEQTNSEWIQEIIGATTLNTQHTFLFLTKNPIRYMEFLFSDNCWLGETITANSFIGSIYPSHEKKFISFEPLLGETPQGLIEGYQQIIVGSLNKNRQPVKPENGGTKKEWVYPILKQADKYKVPVFIKDELLRLHPDLPKRKELAWKINNI